ncbi:MAG: hypothetical protein CMJ48_08845 [Planctomycetaceae bacterium]|nr:hypothetical protein [Planctomycetaceae bacterium]
MFLKLLLLFTVVPLLELWLLVRISEHTGLPFTVLLVLTTGILGASLAKRQGVQVCLKVQQQLAAGQAPGGTMVDGLMILIAGALMITPGILTDVVGFAMLTPPVQRKLKTRLTAWFLKKATIHVQPSPASSPPPFSD